MGEAERALNARAKEAEQQRQAEAHRVQADKDLRMAAALMDIDRLIPEVLDVLRKRGFPGAVMVQPKTWFGRRERAAWHLLDLPGLSSDNDPYPKTDFWFLSDGTFLIHGFNGNKATSARASGVYPPQIQGGLEKLLARYA